MLKKILIGLFVLFVAIQFIRPEKNLSAAPPAKDDLLVSLGAPPEVKHLMEIGCYDCHSSNTRYPWYAEVQPVGWWVKRHIDDARHEFNFSIFGSYSTKKKKTRLDDLSDAIKDRSMPLKSYTWIHRDAIYTEAQIKTLTDWIAAAQDKLDDEK